MDNLKAFEMDSKNLKSWGETKRKLIEKLINEGVVKTNNEYGYIIDATTIAEINKLGYGVTMGNKGVSYFKF